MDDARDPKPFRVEVERGKVREFAMATRARDRAYLDDPDPVAPPTFLASAAFWAGHENSALARANLDIARVLHGEQEYVFHGAAPRAGQTLIAQQRIESEFTKQGKRGGTMRFIVFVTQFRTQDGELVVEARSTVIETGQPDGGSS